MDLLGTPLLLVLGLTTVVAPLITCLLWGRVRGPRAMRVVVRAGLLLGSQLCAFALVAALINDYALFYKSWSELSSSAAAVSGATPTAATTDQSLTRPGHASAGQVADVHTYPGYGNPARWPQTGRLESVTIRGAASALNSHAFVYLPPQYFRSRAYFPAVEVFTGYPGMDQYLVSRLKYPEVFRRVIAQHRAEPAVLVMMRPSVTFPRDSECTDVPSGPLAETFFGVDVPAAISATYRVQPTGWGAMGDSTGGYCAVKLAMLNPTTFGSAVSLSGYYFALRDHTTGDLWGGSLALRHVNDLGWRMRELPAPPVQLLIGTSPDEKGTDGYAEAMRFAQLARAPMRVSLLRVPRGGHNFATWSAELPAALSWLTARLPPDCPTPFSAQGRGDLGQVPAKALAPQALK